MVSQQSNIASPALDSSKPSWKRLSTWSLGKIESTLPDATCIESLENVGELTVAVKPFRKPLNYLITMSCFRTAVACGVIANPERVDASAQG